MQFIRGIGSIADGYDGFIIDLWGVIHNGIAPYPEALNCLEELTGRPVLLLSNAPRRVASAQHMLRRMGVHDRLYSHILTSGEAAWKALRDRADPWFASLGTRAYHLGPERDRNVLEDLGVEVVASPDQADFTLNTGPDDDMADAASLDAFIPELQNCLSAGLKMICANPDLIVMRGGVRLLCAGTLAQYYRDQGGDVVSLGKPDPAIYAMAEAMMGVPRGRVLAIGDSLHTDIGGAQAAGIDSVWVLGGIHAEAVGDDFEQARHLAKAAGAAPKYIMSHLAW